MLEYLFREFIKSISYNRPKEHEFNDNSDNAFSYYTTKASGYINTSFQKIVHDYDNT